MHVVFKFRCHRLFHFDVRDRINETSNIFYYLRFKHIRYKREFHGTRVQGFYSLKIIKETIFFFNRS